MEGLVNMLANLCASDPSSIEAAIIAVVKKPADGSDIADTEIVIIGENALTIFGLIELVKLQTARNLEGEG